MSTVRTGTEIAAAAAVSDTSVSAPASGPAGTSGSVLATGADVMSTTVPTATIRATRTGTRRTPTDRPPNPHGPATDEVIVDRASSTIASLDRSSHQIRQVVTLIRQVTAQSRLLALDGTIEAARAGEAGRQRRRS